LNLFQPRFDVLPRGTSRKFPAECDEIAMLGLGDELRYIGVKGCAYLIEHGEMFEFRSRKPCHFLDLRQTDVRKAEASRRVRKVIGDLNLVANSTATGIDGRST